MKVQAIRGTHDILPEDAALFQKLEAQARAVFASFGFGEIRTPTFESLDLFHRTLGETTDVIEKEMYVFQDRGGRQLALRPEGTAGVVRAFVEHHLGQTKPFCKLFYIGSMFRAERPQAGRYREFFQIGAESFGNAAPTADAEMLLLIQTLYKALGLTITLKLNSLGDEKCRPEYRKALLVFLESKRSTLCEDCLRRIDRNPLRVLDCKIDGPRLTDLPTVDQFWCAPCRTHFESVRQLLDRSGVTYVFTPRLVRGLDYYSRTVFEVTGSTTAAQDALAAGGRYDKLVKQMDGPDTPALGFALGSERTVEAMRQAGLTKEPLHRATIFVAALGEAVVAEAFNLLQSLRLNPELAQRRVLVEGGFFEKKIGAQLGIADRLGAQWVLILGEDEWRAKEITLRNLQSGVQTRHPIDQVASHLLAVLPQP